jgi:hypothetical protein
LTFSLVHRNFIEYKWVYKIKRKVNGLIDYYKAHLVTKGSDMIFYYDNMIKSWALQPNVSAMLLSARYHKPRCHNAIIPKLFGMPYQSATICQALTPSVLLKARWNVLGLSPDQEAKKKREEDWVSCCFGGMFGRKETKWCLRSRNIQFLNWLVFFNMTLLCSSVPELLLMTDSLC